MSSLVRVGGKLPAGVLVLALEILAFCGPSAGADDGCAGPAGCQGSSACAGNHPGACESTVGTLGYGPPGLYPGFQGFGLGYHLGYGYGGRALGVGAEGGYPFYSGPGYPHGEPPLRRFKRIAPFAYFGGPGYPTPDHPNFFGGTAALAADKPVVIEGDPETAGGYGAFTGTVPYPASYFAPFATEAGSERSSTGVKPAMPMPNWVPGRGAGSDAPAAPVPPGPGAVNGWPARGRILGIDTVQVAEADAVRGLKVSKVYPGTAAEAAGLRAGDVIRSVNGHAVERPDNLTWIIANASQSGVLTINARTGRDGKEHTVKAQLREAAPGDGAPACERVLADSLSGFVLATRVEERDCDSSVSSAR